MTKIYSTYRPYFYVSLIKKEFMVLITRRPVLTVANECFGNQLRAWHVITHEPVARSLSRNFHTNELLPSGSIQNTQEQLTSHTLFPPWSIFVGTVDITCIVSATINFYSITVVCRSRKPSCHRGNCWGCPGSWAHPFWSKPPGLVHATVIIWYSEVRPRWACSWKLGCGRVCNAIWEVGYLQLHTWKSGWDK